MEMDMKREGGQAWTNWRDLKWQSQTTIKVEKTVMLEDRVPQTSQNSFKTSIGSNVGA